MDLTVNLFSKLPDSWNGSMAEQIMILSLVITAGIALAKINVRGVSFGKAWILFVGLAVGHFFSNIDVAMLRVMSELGLILFVYSIGLEVGPGFFSSFKNGGLALNALSAIVAFLGVTTAVLVFFFSDLSMASVAGVLSGAVTNTPALGAAQQAFSDVWHLDAPEIASAYAITYPLGVVGVIFAFIILRFCFRIKTVPEEKRIAEMERDLLDKVSLSSFSVRVDNEMINGATVKKIQELMLNRQFNISRIRRADNGMIELAEHHTLICVGDVVLVVAHPSDRDAICALLGAEVSADWTSADSEMKAKRIVITRPEINSKRIAQLRLRSSFGVNITRVSRSGMDLVPTSHLTLLLGDRLTVVGSDKALAHVERLLGNSIRDLNIPNLLPVFLGIVIGCILADMPISLPGISQSVKLGLAGGPLIVAILIGYLGPKYNLVTYNTIGANLMLREFGLCIFFAAVGLTTGKDFVNAVASEVGPVCVFYGLAITLIPVLIAGFIGRRFFHLNFFTLMGLLAGANTNPSALAYANALTHGDSPSVAYSSVYPFSMFLRIILIQIMIFFFN